MRNRIVWPSMLSLDSGLTILLTANEANSIPNPSCLSVPVAQVVYLCPYSFSARILYIFVEVFLGLCPRKHIQAFVLFTGFLVDLIAPVEHYEAEKGSGLIQQCRFREFFQFSGDL